MHLRGLALVAALVAFAVEARADDPRTGAYLAARAGLGASVGAFHHDTTTLGPEPRQVSVDETRAGLVVDVGVAAGASVAPGWALALNAGALVVPGEPMGLGHAGPLLDVYPGDQRVWHVQGGASFGFALFSVGADFAAGAESVKPPPSVLFGPVVHAGGGLALSDTWAPGVFAHVHVAPLFGDETTYVPFVFVAGADLRAF